MARYSAYGTRTIGTGANDTILAVVADSGGAALRRLKFDHFMLGLGTTPADGQIVLRARRCTALGSGGTTFTPIALDPGDGATLTDAHYGHTSTPTYTADSQMIQFGFHQKACPIFWYAPPGGEIVTPATASNGIGFDTPVISTGTPDAYMTLHWTE